MVGLRILGLLGNHLFQYMFIYKVSKKLRTPFYIEYGKARMTIQRLNKYFHLKNYHPIRNFIYCKIHRVNEEVTIDSLKSPEQELIKIKNNVIYNGFVQSEKYFLDPDLNVHEIFKIRKKYVHEFNNKYQQLFEKNKTIVIHVRRGDFIEAGADFLGGTDLRLPLTYYENALSKINNLAVYKIIFISDDIPFCQQHFRDLLNCQFESNNEIIDLQLIMKADIAIISNSTFAWWGAYLNKKKYKQIFCPKHWLGFLVKQEFPVGIASVNGWNYLEI